MKFARNGKIYDPFGVGDVLQSGLCKGLRCDKCYIGRYSINDSCYDFLKDHPHLVARAMNWKIVEDAEKPIQKNVSHPEHYQGKHECIDEMRALFGDEAVKDFCRCNIYKYKYRADMKNGEEDLKKAEWYMDYLMNMERETNES